MDDRNYKLLRKEFIEDPSTVELLPQFLRTCIDAGDFWRFIKGKFRHYQERRDFLREEFGPLLLFLEQKDSPAVDLISDALRSYDESDVHRVWRKALLRSATDPDGAVTAARTLLEEVCKHLLDEGVEPGTAYGPTDDLPKLYRLASEKLNLAPSQHSEEAFKRILGGCASVVEGLGSLRNKIGDAHAKGKRPLRVLPRHAHLAVNFAGAMALYLVETFAARGAEERPHPEPRNL
jgi:hypothetical protein